MSLVRGLVAPELEAAYDKGWLAYVDEVWMKGRFSADRFVEICKLVAEHQKEKKCF